MFHVVADNGVTICLEETGGRTGAYICVSHRWVEGKTVVCATTSSNYSERRAGTSFEALPNIFGDVFNLAAQLDIEFVWIDSLCIIQDSFDDWKSESLRMGGYYQQSRFTVAATASTERAADGLFSAKTRPASFRLAQLPYFDTGWTLYQMKPNTLRTAWERAVEAYSRTQFTKPTEDRIIALSGVAGEFQAALQSVDEDNKLNKFVSGTHQRLSTFPTWSWAFIYTQVNWDHGRKYSWSPASICRVRKVVMTPPSCVGQLDAATLDISSTAAEATDELVVASYGHDNSQQGQLRATAIQENFAVLYLSGRLHPIHVGPLLEEEKQISPHASPATLITPAGWASIEHPDLQDAAAIQSGGLIYALFVLLDYDVEVGFLFFGNLLPRHTVYQVLLLRRVDRLLDGFERVDVGRLFGPEAQTAFRTARERIVKLV
ncbi:hypothetical protein QBC34DRAFT_448567 [Podospora aff. communis PSN243]|uniref:Heterokaryon incompatibility domain-containing protein n=1 Tax=Podospora aff. communis PSN243 TaxID=3040156 RepID=A0AAV9GNC8_9PEZI|nr:hypothetical protein QBC34DRAFT_448567 [Podospora aff. communis PSN243]